MYDVPGWRHLPVQPSQARAPRHTTSLKSLIGCEEANLSLPTGRYLVMDSALIPTDDSYVIRLRSETAFSILDKPDANVGCAVLLCR